MGYACRLHFEKKEMPTITFDICPSHDCKSLAFHETTCRQPAVETGYGQVEDESLYSGYIQVFDSLGALIFEKVVPASASKKPYLLILDEEAPLYCFAGFYTVRYVVKDESGAVIGYDEAIISMLCDIACKAEDFALSLCKPCCQAKLSKALYGYAMNLTAAKVLAEMGKIDQAQLAYAKAWNAVNTKCNC